jgi:hypothetical protein
MHASTQPAFDTALPRVSDFQRRQRAAGDTGYAMAGPTQLSALDRSLLQDLRRLEADAHQQGGLDVLEVAAAAVRHGRVLRLMLQHEERVLPLTVRPIDRTVHAPRSPAHWALLRWSALRVLQVEPAGKDPLPAEHTVPLGMVLWALALHGARAELLPEIAGPAAYRIVPGTDLSALDLGGALAEGVERLRRKTSSLREIESWTGLTRERATRLLKGLYLQAGLLVSRAHPAAAGAF